MNDLPTQFAPPNRAPIEDLERDARLFAQMKSVTPFLDIIPTVCMVLNPQRQVIYGNRALYNTLGLSPDEVCGQRPGELLACIHATNQSGGCGTTEYCRTCGAVWAILMSLNGEKAVRECRIMQRTGDALDLRAWATPFDVEGRRYAILAAEDISAEKRRQALERIFFHDLMNTASSIAGFASAFRDGILTPSERYTEAIYRQARRLIAEIEAQRDLLAAENYELTPNPDLIQADDLLRDMVRTSEFYDIDDCKVVIAPETEGLALTSDPVLLRRVIENMVKNALEASHAGETVALTCAANGDRVEFSVHNPGVMPRDVQLQVFKRSFSTKGDGRGLGTYSMKLLTERYLHGTITFESTPERGTIFRAAYPVAWE